ncbi:hypothetical protein CPCC7001_747 [Cyanobium sp. PCC 7001]|uniref:hypothetical protein n=1 Tax=Cyanobium sp. PCC 7001 TaxID=180281 RepID=UPI0001804B2C|nr:hypothetical protein [Cyanobium sp. PCC 7001]EDY37868.1 hypothetical protein CPCC7001_747 [Cyanobium sp. PCC 7001]
MFAPLLHLPALMHSPPRPADPAPVVITEAPPVASTIGPAAGPGRTAQPHQLRRPAAKRPADRRPAHEFISAAEAFREVLERFGDREAQRVLAELEKRGAYGSHGVHAPTLDLVAEQVERSHSHRASERARVADALFRARDFTR